MKQNKWMQLVTCLVLITTIFSPMAIHASEEKVSYAVKPIMTSNQVDHRHSYFDLKVKPNMIQKLKTVIYNYENEDITVLLSVHNATTNSNGIIVYEETDNIDPSLNIPLTDILSFDQEYVIIPAGEKRTVIATLEMPDEEFDGIILGGMRFEKVNKEDTELNGVQIQNQYAYVIGVQLRENGQVVQPDLSLKKVFPDTYNHRPVVTTLIQNSEPTIIKDLKINAAIYKKGKSELIKEKAQTVNMAPNSTMTFNVEWEKPLEPGEYQIQLDAQHQDQKWEWTETFTIEKEVAKQINTTAIGLEDYHPTDVSLKIVIAILIVIIISLLVYIRRLKLSKKAYEKIDGYR